MNYVSSLTVPLVMVLILSYRLIKHINVFEVFIEGAKEGISTSFSIMPALIALMTAIGMFKASGALDVLTYALQPVARTLGFPEQVMPLALLRPISGSGALAIFEDIIATHGPNSLVGRVASVMQGSTETTFYTIAVYYGAVKISKTRHTLPAALTGDFTGFIMSAIAVRLFLC